MGIFSIIGGAISSLFGGGGDSGGGDSSSTVYEPDKVKAAEIEADTKIRLAHLENDRIELMKQARMDILQFETESQVALEQARAKGLGVMAQTILVMQEKLNEIAEKRLLIIERGSLQVIKDIEMFYDDLGRRLQEDNNDYSTKKLPELLSVLQNYKEDSAPYTIYMKRIEEDMQMQTKHYMMQIEAVSKRQSQVIDGFLQSKERILAQTGEITSGMLETVQKQTLAIESRLNQRDDVPIGIAAPKGIDNLALPDEQCSES